MVGVALVKWLVLAVQFCTIFPAPSPRGVTNDDLRRSVSFYPFVGALLGVLLFIILRISRSVLPPAPAAGLALALYTLFTGALHSDGLMDVMDAIGSRKPREQALEIMRDSRVGAVGSIAGALLLIGKYSALSALPARLAYPFVLVPAASRLGMVFAMNLAPYARADAGLGRVFALRVPRAAVWSAACFTAGLGMLVAPLAIALALPVVAFLAAWGAAFFARRRFGGMTGDLYGALNEVLEWAGWLLCLALLHSMRGGGA